MYTLTLKGIGKVIYVGKNDMLMHSILLDNHRVLCLVMVWARLYMDLIEDSCRGAKSSSESLDGVI